MYKINSQWIIGLNVGMKFLKHLEEKHWRKTLWLWVRQKFLTSDNKITILVNRKNSTLLKLKTIALQKAPLRQQKDNPQAKRRYFQIVYLIKNLHPECIRNLRNSVRRRQTTQLKMNETLEKTFHQKVTPIVNKHKKKCLVSFIIRGCKLKPLRDPITPARTAIIQRPVRWQGLRGTAHAVSTNVKPESTWQFLDMLGIHLPYKPAIPLLPLCPREMKTYVHPKTCTRTFITLLFVIAPSWRQAKCPSAGGWISQMWYIHGGIWPSNRKEDTADTLNSTEVTRKHYAKWTRLKTKVNILYNFIYRTSLGRIELQRW